MLTADTVADHTLGARSSGAPLPQFWEPEPPRAERSLMAVIQPDSKIDTLSLDLRETAGLTRDAAVLVTLESSNGMSPGGDW